jgi:hypothetical protein
MANRKSPSNAQSAPKGKRLAAFAAQIEAEANGSARGLHAAFAADMNKRHVIQSSKLWHTFAQQVAANPEQQSSACRVLAPAFDLLPLP